MPRPLGTAQILLEVSLVVVVLSNPFHSHSPHLCHLFRPSLLQLPHTVLPYTLTTYHFCLAVMLPKILKPPKSSRNPKSCMALTNFLKARWSMGGLPATVSRSPLKEGKITQRRRTLSEAFPAPLDNPFYPPRPQITCFCFRDTSTRSEA